jgi:hypothetical protein
MVVVPACQQNFPSGFEGGGEGSDRVQHEKGSRYLIFNKVCLKKHLHPGLFKDPVYNVKKERVVRRISQQIIL